MSQPSSLDLLNPQLLYINILPASSSLGFSYSAVAVSASKHHDGSGGISQGLRDGQVVSFVLFVITLVILALSCFGSRHRLQFEKAEGVPVHKGAE